MLESIALLAMWAGVGIALYGLGLALDWVLILLVVALLADHLLLRPKRKAPQVVTKEKTPKAIDVRPVKEHSLNETTVHAAREDLKSGQSSAPTPPPPRSEASREDTPPDKAPPWPNNQTRAESPPVDPLDIYRPKQFDAPPRAAPVAESPPPMAIPPIRMPTGPAYVPPATRSVPDRAARSPGTGRPQRPILKPEDYTINAGKRGFIYLARNPEHWDGLFKVGQTLRHPSIRVAELNDLHAKHKDIGTFDLLDVVEVSDAYGAEQVLFLVLADLRPVPKREFFIADKAYLSKLMRAVAAFVSWRPEELNNLYRDLDPNDFPAWPGKTPWYRRPHASGANGWVYLARCQYHLADTYIFGATSETPEAEVAKLNDGQRSDTPQIGFYAVVFALPVWDTKASRTIGWRALAPWRLNGSRSFVRGPLEVITHALTDSLQAAAGHQSP